MRKKNILLIFLLVFFFSVLKPIYGLGLTSAANKKISFEPGLEKTYEFLVQHTTRDVQIEIGGEFRKYVTLSRDFISASDSDKTFSVTIKFPKTSPTPGHHQIRVQANEVVDQENAFGTSVNIATHIKVDVLYPGKYAEVSFGEVNVVNNTAHFAITANNFGLTKIDSFKARIETYDLEDHKLDTVYTDEKSIEPDKKETIKTELNVDGYGVGDHRAKAIVFWDNEQTIVEKVFRVGALKINIVDYTKEFLAGTLNKFEVKLENVWNSPITDVYVIVRINDEVLKSTTEDIAEFGTKTFTIYWDTTNVLPGEYDVEIKAHYLDKITMELGKVKVIEKEIEVKLAKKEFPMFTVLLVVIIILIIIIDILWMKTREREKKKKEKKEKADYIDKTN